LEPVAYQHRHKRAFQTMGDYLFLANTKRSFTHYRKAIDTMLQFRYLPGSLLLGLMLFMTSCVAPAAPATGNVNPPSNSAAAPAAAEQTLVLASGRDLGPVNPHAYDSSMVMLDLVYEPLVRYAPDGSIQPVLAESWEISEDGLIWTFHLRAGVTFHDGTPFDAAAAKWNVEQWAGNERHGWLPTSARIVAIETPDAATLVLTMGETYYPGLQDLTLIRPVRFLSPNAVDAAGSFLEPVGTGAWQVSELANDRAVLSPYAGYWGQQPQLEQIVVEVVIDPQTRVAALLSGEVDVIGGEYLGSIPPESMPVLERNNAVTLLSSEGITCFYMATGYNKAPLDDVRVRQAINHAIDREGMATTIFGGLAEPAVGLLPSTIPYVTRTEYTTYTYSPEAARTLLAEAGWTAGIDGILQKEGERLALNLVVDRARLPQTASMATAIQAQLKEVGVELKLQMLDYTGWLDAFNSNDYDLIMRFTWGSPYDPHTILAGAFSSKQVSVSYTHPELDSLIDAVLLATDEDKRRAIYEQVWSHLDSHAAVVPLVYPQRVYAHRTQVTGFELGGTEYDLAYAVRNVVITE
jgi:peptide/nickel transport system substrate-binding protein